MLYIYEAQRTSANPSKSPILFKQRMAKDLKLQYSTYQSQAQYLNLNCKTPKDISNRLHCSQ